MVKRSRFMVPGLVLLIVVLVAVGCDQGGKGAKPPADAVAVLSPASGSEVVGTVAFARVDRGLRVMAEVRGLSPGAHGFHIHEFGDCTAEDAASAGEHFNPDNQVHGAPDAAQHHAGDLGNLVADENGRAVLDIVAPRLSLEGAAAIIGRGVVVHADADDFTTQPAGAAGQRLACGVIGFARK